MRRRSNDLDATVIRLLVWIGTFERWQESMMNIDNVIIVE
jgi:hypothetical protein